MKKPIRILQMIGSLNVGGSQSMIINIYKAIDREIIQFDFVIDHAGYLHYKEMLENMGAKIYVMPSFMGYNFLEIKRAWDTFFTEHPEYRVLHTHVRSYASIFLPIAKKHGVKTIIHSHSTSNGRGMIAIYKYILQYPLRYQADYYFGCSKESGCWLFGRKIVNKDNFLVIKNGIDVNKYIPNESVRTKVRDEFGFADSDIVYGHVGRFHESKNYPFLLKVFCEISKRKSNSKLVLVGDGELKKDIIQEAKDLDISEKIIFTGIRDDIASILQGFDCFLFPSKWEGLPVTLVEAQAAGLPCIVSDKITREVNLTDSIIYLPIDSGVDEWVNEALCLTGKRMDNASKIRKKGFDIAESAKMLEKLYYSIYCQGDQL